MIKNALNGVKPDTCILQIITQQELRKKLILKIKFPVQIRGKFYKIEKENRITISVFEYGNKVNYPIYR